MTTITIPKELAQKGELVVIPRNEYEELLMCRQVIPVVKLTSTEKRAFEKGRKEILKVEYVTLKELENELGVAHSKKR